MSTVLRRVFAPPYPRRVVAESFDPMAETEASPTGRGVTTLPGASGRDALPERIDRFEVIRELGRGGMGVVYLARDDELERELAIKLLPESGGDAERLRREAKAMAKLSHPNIGGVYDVGTHEGSVYVAMEYVSGRTLRQWMKDRPDSATVLEVYRQAALGLAAAHEVGLVHRDFKPDNAMLGFDGRVRVLDFGLARADGLPPEEGDADPGDRPLGLTATGAMVGTPRYMAPEQFAGQPAGPAADQFALAVSIYEALFDVRPYEGDTITTLARSVARGRIREPRITSAAYALWPPLRKAMSVDPAERYATVSDLIGALEACNTSDPPRRRLPALAAVGVLVIAASAAAVWWPREGDLDPALIQQAVQHNGPTIAACWTEALERSPGAHGRVVLRFTIAEDGTVENAAIDDRGIFDAEGQHSDDPEAIRCMVQALSGWTFPEPDGGPVQVEYPFVLTATGG